MADDTSVTTGWYIWFTELSIVPAEYHYILRMISWFFITLALTPIVPIALLVIYDVLLWLWRLSAASRRVTHVLPADGATGLPRWPIEGRAPDVSAESKKTN
ncbi:hypothetical protein VTK56DRAFT_4523 [Thermocarpiscus australiensis]